MSRDPVESLRRVGRVMAEEAALLTECWPTGAVWLERLAGRLLAVAESLAARAR